MTTHPTASEITDDQLDALRLDLAEARHIAEGNFRVAMALTTDREHARNTAIALENELTEARDAINRVRALHSPQPCGGDTVCAVCCGGTYDCESVPWPCDTIQQLNGDSTDQTERHA